MQGYRRSATDACLNAPLFEDDEEEEVMSVFLHSAMLYERYSSLSSDSYEQTVNRKHSPDPEPSPRKPVRLLHVLCLSTACMVVLSCLVFTFASLCCLPSLPLPLARMNDILTCLVTLRIFLRSDISYQRLAQLYFFTILFSVLEQNKSLLLKVVGMYNFYASFSDR